jgi:5-formyltetrahydrofolate cyclo-ligase
MAYNGTGGRRHPLVPTMKSRKDFRRLLRAARRGMDPRSRRRAESLIVRKVRRLTVYRNARGIAAYLPFDGEVDLSRLLEHAIEAGKAIYLPAVGQRRERPMRFIRIRPGDRLRANRFGIGEPIPVAGKREAPGRISLILLPVVGFDESGTRLGMGGGFYDRCLASLAPRTLFRKRLVGIAFECQKLDGIPRMEWDVPLSAIVTERAVYRGSNRPEDTLLTTKDQR